MNEPDRRCVNAHDRCWECMGDCPLCEIVRWRDERGRFASPYAQREK